MISLVIYCGEVQDQENTSCSIRIEYVMQCLPSTNYKIRSRLARLHVDLPVCNRTGHQNNKAMQKIYR